MALNGCPSVELLRAFALGDLPSSTFEQMADHVIACKECNASLSDLDNFDDELLNGLRQLRDAAMTEPITVPAEWIAKAQTTSGGPFHSDATEVAVDSGRMLAKKLADGPCKVGKFELLDELGVGSFGYVFRAHDTELDRTVAMKIQRASSIASADEAKRFLREARSVAQLTHPNITSLYETGQTEEGVCYLVTEYVEGTTLEQWLELNRPTSTQIAEQILQLADALHYAHQHGVIHRDVKPSNVMIDGEGCPHMMDFGLAKREAGDVTMTPDGQVMGTPAYMSPEQARGDSHTVDVRSDVYSLGVILYEMMTGERPFQGIRRMLLLQVLEDEPRPPRRLNDKIPRDLETICLKAMAKSTARRYQSAREFAEDLRRFLAGEPIMARPEGYVGRVWRWCRRNPFAATLLLGICLGSASGFTYLTSLSKSFVEQAAIESARMESEMLEELTKFYSELVGRLDSKKVHITPQYKEEEGSLPIPATFTIDAGERISETNSGMKVRLYSRFPWPYRKEGGPQDEFERLAIDWLEENPAQPFMEFTDVDGRQSLLYASARLMEKSCIDCHNESKQSPKHDWKVGDLAGVLKIERPLDRDVARIQDSLRGAFLLMIGTATTLLGVCIVVLIARGRT